MWELILAIVVIWLINTFYYSTSDAGFKPIVIIPKRISLVLFFRYQQDGFCLFLVVYQALIYVTLISALFLRFVTDIPGETILRWSAIIIGGGFLLAPALGMITNVVIWIKRKF